MKVDPRPLVVHVLHRFDVGGLENGVVNLINRMAPERFRHAVVALTEVTDFKRRVKRDDVRFIAIKKPPGQGLWQAPLMYRILREMQPAIVHTRNLAALEMALPAAWARVPVRIHGEHGWDTSDPDGSSRKFRLVRRLYKPFVHRYVALSRHLERYLIDHVGVDAGRVSQVYNGVDTQRFRPASGAREVIAGSPFSEPQAWFIGTVGRLQEIKDQVLLARAFVRVLEMAPAARQRMRLVIAGEGNNYFGKNQLWYIPANGGEMHAVGVSMPILQSISFDHDGRQLGFTRASGSVQVWQIKNLFREVRAAR